MYQWDRSDSVMIYAGTTYRFGDILPGEAVTQDWIAKKWVSKVNAPKEVVQDLLEAVADDLEEIASLDASEGEEPVKRRGRPSKKK